MRYIGAVKVYVEIFCPRICWLYMVMNAVITAVPFSFKSFAT